MSPFAGVPSFGHLAGMRIVQSAMVPTKRVPGPTVIWRSKGHPLVYWLARQLARIGVTLEPDVLTPRPSWIDQPQVLLMGGTIFVHPDHYSLVMAQLSGVSPDRSAV